MLQEFPAFLSDFLAGGDDEDLRVKLKRKQMASDELEFATTAQGSLAEEEIGMCFVAQAWGRDSAILGNIFKILPEFLPKENMASRLKSWQLMTWVGAFYEREGKIQEALDWYLTALSQFENLLEMIADPDTRRAAYSSLHSADMYCDLFRTSLALALEVDESNSRKPKNWALYTSSRIEQALIFRGTDKASSLLDILLSKDTTETEQLRD